MIEPSPCLLIQPLLSKWKNGGKSVLVIVVFPVWITTSVPTEKIFKPEMNTE
jgi:hypothetical protein